MCSNLVRADTCTEHSFNSHAVMTSTSLVAVLTSKATCQYFWSFDPANWILILRSMSASAAQSSQLLKNLDRCEFHTVLLKAVFMVLALVLKLEYWYHNNIIMTLFVWEVVMHMQ